MPVLRRGRATWRSRRDDRRPRWFDVPEESDPDAEEDYDRFGMMMNIDALERPWRDLVNEHGFTAVVQVRSRSPDIEGARRLLAERWRQRQRQLALGST